MPTDELVAVPASLALYLERASETANLPAELGPPHVGESMLDLHNRLLVTRASMTSLSGLIGELTIFQGKVEASLIERRGLLEEAEAEVLSSRKKSLMEDFSSAKEKNAKLGAETLEQLRAVRNAEKLLAQVKSVVIYCRDRHREIDRAVRDIDTRIKIVQFEDSQM